MPSNIPTIRSLMEDPTYRAYMKRVPRLPANLRTGDPWQVWADRGEGRWATVLRPTYADAWRTFLTLYRSDNRPDVTVVSRRMFYAPPGEWYKVRVRDKSQIGAHIEYRWRQTFFWDEIDLHWCGRCRRPVYWMPLFSNHHAVKRFPAAAEDDNYRCIICGIRWIATPDIRQMVKMEAMPK